jgi:hypothetical protein
MSEVVRAIKKSYGQQAQATTESKALVVVKDGELDKAAKTYWPKIKKARRTVHGSDTGKADGHAAGKNIQFRGGIGGSNSQTRIG